MTPPLDDASGSDASKWHHALMPPPIRVTTAMDYFDALACIFYVRIVRSSLARRLSSELRDFILEIADEQIVIRDFVKGTVSDSESTKDQLVLDLRKTAQAIEELALSRVAANYPHISRMKKLEVDFRLQPGATSIMELLAYAMNASSVQRLFDHCFAHRLPLRRSSHLTYSLASSITAIPLNSFRSLVAVDGPLINSGLIHIDDDGDFTCGAPVRYWMTESALDDSVRSLSEYMLGAPQRGSLEWSNFTDYVDHAETLRSILSGALKNKNRGINILIHGPAGTGKTEFAKTLTSISGAELFAIGEADDDGAPPTTNERLSSLRFAQKLDASTASAYLLDEADDVLHVRHQGGGPRQSRLVGSKIYVNRVLEDNKHPVIWILNDADDLDPAILRRMTWIQRMRRPPRKSRQRIWDSLLERHGIALDQSTLRKVVHDGTLTPAIIDSALRHAKLCPEPTSAVPEILSGHAQLQRYTAGQHHFNGSHHEMEFDCRWIRCTDPDWVTIRELTWKPGMPRFSVLISGEPGTGKTAFARNLAERWGMQSRLASAASVLGAFVGESEQNLANHFEEARQDGALLIIDEVDSFLGSKTSKSSSWERSLVNEFLTQMDSYTLPLICTTNHRDWLDHAARRRFTFSLKFEPLTPPQASDLCFRFFGFNLKEAPEGLTPADFAKVNNRFQLLGGQIDAERVIELLLGAASDRGLKPAPTPLGFLRGK